MSYTLPLFNSLFTLTPELPPHHTSLSKCFVMLEFLLKLGVLPRISSALLF